MFVELSCFSAGVVRALELGDDRLRQHLAQLHAPLVERVDVPDRALREDAVLVERDEAAERGRREPVREDRVRRAVALEDAVRHELRRARPRPSTSSAVLPNASASAWANTLASRMS